MHKLIYYFTVLLVCFHTGLQAQNFVTSNLPILVFDTQGQEIPDEPKLTAHLGIIYNGEGQTNNITDPFNDYDGFIGVELRGQTSMFFPKRPLGFETRNADGTNNNVSIVGLPAENDWVLHNPYSDKTLIRNAFSYKLAEQIMTYAPRTRMVEVVINGSYEGVYLLTENIKVDDNRVNIAKLNPEDIDGDELTGGYIVKLDKTDNGDITLTSNYAPNSASGGQTIEFIYHSPKTLKPEQLDYIENFLHSFEDALANDDFSDPEGGYHEYIDVSSFVDYLIINEITRNVDGYRISTYLYKDKDSNDPRLKIGPVWDYNLALGNADYCFGSSQYDWAYNFNDVCPNDNWLVPFWWEKLMSDSSFTAALNTRWQELRSDVFSDTRLNFICDSLTDLTAAAANRNYQRYPDVLGQYIWPNNFVGNTWQEEIDYMCGWMNDRVEFLDTGFENLTGEQYDATKFFTPTVTPNISSGNFVFDFYVVQGTDVSISIFDAQGQLVENLKVTTQSQGAGQLIWDSYNVPKGMYFYSIATSLSEKVYGGKLVKI